MVMVIMAIGFGCAFSFVQEHTKKHGLAEEQDLRTADMNHL